MKDSVLRNKATDFSVEIIKFIKHSLKERDESSIANQLMRASTSIGANINEAAFAISIADFVSKMHIALKECSESLYWLEILNRIKIDDKI